MPNSRSGKWYRKNEADVMKYLGLKPTRNSGSTWIEKSDGQNDDVICELKSTDKTSYRIQKQDLDTLMYNAAVEHKVPVFALQFIQSDELYLIVKPGDLEDLVAGLNGVAKKVEEDIIDVKDRKAKKPKKIIGGSKSARDAYHEEKEKKYNKIKEAT